MEGFAPDKGADATEHRRMMPLSEGAAGASAWVPEGGSRSLRNRRLLVAVPAAAMIVIGAAAAFALPGNDDVSATEAVPAPIVETPTPTPTAEEIERPEKKDASRNSPRGDLKPAAPKAIGGFVEKKVEKTGTMYATETLNVRSKASAESEKIGSIAQGDAVDIAEDTDDGWQQVLVDGEAGWVSAEYLSDSKPTTPESDSDDSDDSGSGSSGSSDSGSDEGSSGSNGSGGSSSRNGSSNCPTKSGLTSAAQAVLNDVCAQWGGSISAYGGVRPGDSGKHGSGQAVDFMISDSSVGWEVANYLRNNASSLGVTEVIYAQKIWTTQRSGEGWRGMSDRGSATANHYDHVHVSVG